MKRFLISIFVVLNIQTAFAAENWFSVEMKSNKAIGDSTIGGTATHYMRFPQLITRLFQQELIRTNYDPRIIYIMGPGLNAGHIPQLHEIVSLYSCGVLFDKITVVDVSEKVLSAIPGSRYKQELALKILDEKTNFGNIQNGNLLFKDAGYTWNFLKGFVEEIDPILPEGITTVQSDFTTMELAENSVDIMIATFTFQYPLATLSDDERTAFVNKIFHSLKQGGTLYVNEETGEDMMKAYRGIGVFGVTVLPSYTNEQFMGSLHLTFATSPTQVASTGTSSLIAITRK